MDDTQTPLTELQSTFEIVRVGNYIEGEYRKCLRKDKAGSSEQRGEYRKCYIKDKADSDGQQFECAGKIVESRGLSDGENLAVFQPSKYVLRMICRCDYKERTYHVYERFECTLQSWLVVNYDSIIQQKLTVFGFIDDIVHGVEELHNKFKVSHGNISTSNIFLVKNSTGGLRAKLGIVGAQSLQNMSNPAIEIATMEDHEKVWDIVGEIFTPHLPNLNGYEAAEAMHFTQLKKKCSCNQFAFYLKHPFKLVHPEERCGWRLYTELQSNFYGCQPTLGDCIDNIAANSTQRQNTMWKKNVAANYPEYNQLKFFNCGGHSEYQSIPSSFMRFSKDAIRHFNINQHSRQFHKSFQQLDSELSSMWEEFLNLLFEGYCDCKIWSLCPHTP